MFKRLLFCVPFVLVGCQPCQPKQQLTAQQQIQAQVDSIVFFGEEKKVAYFPMLENDFGETLAQYLKENPELEVASMSGDGSHSHGRNHGFFVVFNVRR